MNAVERILGPADPAAPALLTLEATHSHGELRDTVDRAASALVGAGLAKGDKVGLLAENSWFAVVAYLATLKAGGVAVPLPVSISADHCREIASSTRMRIAFLQQRAATLAPALAGVGLGIWDARGPTLAGATNLRFEELLARADGPATPPAIDPARDLAVLLFTSGSTSRPRGVMLSHRNLIANTDSILSYLELTSADRVMAVLPFHYSFGASLLHTHLAVGASLVLDHRFMYPDKVLARMQETRCTGFAGVPSHYQILLRRSALKQMAFPHLRWLQQAGGKLADSFIIELRATLPAVRLFVMYGATEATARISYLPPEQLDRRLGSIGRGIPGVELMVLDPDGRPVAPGETGEIVVAGDNIALGYLDDPAETAATFKQGRLHTGDLARVDEDGFVFIVGRGKEFLKAGGARVSCRQIEDALLTFPDVVEVAVLAVPDELLGEAPVAVVVPRDAADETLVPRLQQHAARTLAPTLRPKQVRVAAALPKSEGGKVQRAALRRLFEEIA